VLNLYRRHSRACKAGHPKDSHSSEFDECKRSWKLCDCTIGVSGTLAGKFIRRTAKRTNWDEARAVSDAWERGEFAQVATVPPMPPDAPERITIADVLTAYLANRAAREPRPATMSNYRTLTTQLMAFAEFKGYAYLDQFTTTDMDAFYASWKGGKSSRGKKLERAKGFWNFCKKRNWIAVSPMEDLEPPVGYSLTKNKSPFSDEELSRIFDAAAAWKTCPWYNGGQKGEITADMVVTFIMLLLETGLRISDGSTFNVVERINPIPRRGVALILDIDLKLREQLSVADEVSIL
jgi:hypothetical protein